MFFNEISNKENRMNRAKVTLVYLDPVLRWTFLLISPFHTPPQQNANFDFKVLFILFLNQAFS